MGWLRALGTFPCKSLVMKNVVPLKANDLEILMEDLEILVGFVVT